MIISAWRSRRRGGIPALKLSIGLNRELERRLVLRACSFLLLLMCTACLERRADAPLILQARLESGQLQLTLDAAPRGAQLEVRDRRSRLVQRLPLRDEALEQGLAFAWQPGEQYLLRIKPPQLEDSSPAPVQDFPVIAPLTGPLRVTLHLPYGQTAIPLNQGVEPTLGALVEAGSSIQLGLEVALDALEPWDVQLALELPTDVQALPLNETLPAAPDASRVQLELQPGAAPSLWRVNLKLPLQEQSLPVRVLVRARRQTEEGPSTLEPELQAGEALSDAPLLQEKLELEGRALLQVRSPDAIRALIVQGEGLFPTDRRGRAQRYRPPDTVMMADPLWRSLEAIMDAQRLSHDPYLPYAYQTQSFTNLGEAPATLLLRSRVLERNREQEPPSFVPRAFEVTGGTGQITTLARIPAGAQGLAVLPVYVQPDVRAGSYRQVLEVTLMGSNEVLYRLERPLQVVRTQLRVNLALLIAIPSSLLGLLWLILHYRRLMEGLQAQALTTIALFGALMFSASFLVDFLSVGLNLVLGPFNLLVGGMLYEVLHHLLLATLLVLLPRPGVATLLGLTHYLLRGLTTAQLSPVDLFFVGSALSYKEGLLYAFGVTRASARTTAALVPGSGWRLMSALTLASALTAFSSLGLHSVFYRLFFASWYVGLAVLVGIVGPLLGVWMGRRFGESLHRIRD